MKQSLEPAQKTRTDELHGLAAVLVVYQYPAHPQKTKTDELHGLSACAQIIKHILDGIPLPCLSSYSTSLIY